MVFKCVGMGNRLMGDDGVGLIVLDDISKDLAFQEIPIIYGETDAFYTFSGINDNDFLYVIDAVDFDLLPGTIKIIPIIEALQFCHLSVSQHQISLFHLLQQYNKKVRGFLIGIQIENIDFSLSISSRLSIKLPEISKQILEFIITNKKENFYA